MSRTAIRMAALVAFGLAATAAPAHAATFTVINGNSGGAGSLRSAINAANQTPARDEIRFAIPGNGTHTIALANDLPTIVAPLEIKGYTQPGSDPATATAAADPTIVIDAANASRGLDIGSDDVEVRGLAIHSAQVDGIFAEGSGIVIAGNHIGTDRAGTAALPNGGDGVVVFATGNTVGGADPADRNVIVGGVAGVRIDSGGEHTVQGNRIGTNAQGDAALGNGTGVIVESSGNTVGDNLLSGQDTGLEVTGEDNTIEGNLVGTNLDGDAALANQKGVLVDGGADNLLRDNLVSGNTLDGLRFAGGASSNDVQSNLIGTEATGGSALANGRDGVSIADSDANTVSDNVISGNDRDGVRITGDDNRLLANRIGVDAGGDELGNEGDGVRIEGDENTLGDAIDPAALNTIAHNDGNGVTVVSGIANAVLRSAIYGNGDLGIDLADDGVTANDFLDLDGGANNLQNHPRVTSATAGAVTTVGWTLSSLANTEFRLEFYANDACDGSGSGEGQVYLGTAVVTTNALGVATGTTALGALSTVGQDISMTATRRTAGIDQGTSELSSCVAAA